MKALKFLSAALLLAASFTACKKDEVKSPASSVEGKWTGFKGYYNDALNNDLWWTIKPGGAIEETNTGGAVKGSGSWVLNGINFTAQYKFKAPLNTVYSFKGTFDKVTGKITGTWGFDDDNSAEGNWYCNKLP